MPASPSVLASVLASFVVASMAPSDGADEASSVSPLKSGKRPQAATHAIPTIAAAFDVPDTSSLSRDARRDANAYAAQSDGATASNSASASFDAGIPAAAVSSGAMGNESSRRNVFDASFRASA